jgi:guanylate kinase
MNDHSVGSLAILSGPSGVGKSTLIAEVLRQYPELYFSVSYTTRSPRPGEVDGVNYHFVDVAEFERMIRDDELLEYANYSGNYYGTSARLIDEKLNAGIDVLLDIEVVGSQIVHDKRPDTPLIFIIPPSFDELSRRLHGRHTDSEEVIQRRLDRAREELKEAARYDYLVVNDSVTQAAQEVLAILRAEGCRTSKRIHLIKEDK